MKLRTKLLPLTGIAAIGATVAPIAMTSCNKEADPTLEVDMAKMIAGEWEPSFEQLTGSFTETDMTNKYYEFMSKDYVHLAEDLACSSSLSSNDSIDGAMKIWINNIDSTNHSLSLKIDCEAKLVQSSNEVGDAYMHYGMECVNIPFSIQWKKVDESLDKYNFVLCTSWSQEQMLAAKDWKIYYYDHSEFSGWTSTQKYEASDSSSENEKKNVFDKMNGFGFISYYLENCQKSE